MHALPTVASPVWQPVLLIQPFEHEAQDDDIGVGASNERLLSDRVLDDGSISAKRDRRPDGLRPQRATERDPPTERVADDRHGRSGVPGDHLGGSRDVLEFALDSVWLHVTGGAPAATVHRVDRVPPGEQRTDDAERRVIGAGAMDEEQRRTTPCAEKGDGRSVGSGDDT